MKYTHEKCGGEIEQTVQRWGGLEHHCVVCGRIFYGTDLEYVLVYADAGGPTARGTLYITTVPRYAEHAFDRVRL